MLVELGHFALVLALLVALMQGVLPLVGASVRSRPLMDLARPAALVQFGLVALAFGIFMHAHMLSKIGKKPRACSPSLPASAPRGSNMRSTRLTIMCWSRANLFRMCRRAC